MEDGRGEVVESEVAKAHLLLNYLPPPHPTVVGPGAKQANRPTGQAGPGADFRGVGASSDKQPPV